MNQTSEAPFRPLDALLAGYCAGALEPATHALVASHLILKPENRPFVAALEQLAAGGMETLDPRPLPERDRRLAAIFESPAPRLPEPVSATLPAPIARIVGKDVRSLAWRSKLPGVREYRIGANGRGEASLLWIRGGRRMPSHTHEGSEITLVLSGAFSDVTGRYARGDIAIAEADLDHRPMTDAGEDCLCFAVTDAPLHLTGPVGRLLERVFGARS